MILFNAFNIVFKFIVEETNKYAENYLANKDLTSSSKFLKWERTSPRIKNFLGLLLLQGLIKKPWKDSFVLNGQF